MISDTVVAERFEPHRTELTGYCYRMLGSAFEAEDAVQETLVRAWRGFGSFEGRASVRTWLYRIATNVCLDMVKGTQRRARPMDLTNNWSGGSIPDALPEATWIGPAPDDRMLPESGDPAELAAHRDSVRLAFVAVLQSLPPRQRAVLILREVLAFPASEVAELLDTTVASVNSALQRARATMAERDDAEPVKPLDDAQRDLLARYLTAFEQYDLESLTTLLRQDAIMSMPPLPLWLSGRAAILDWISGPGSGCRGSRLIPTSANGSAAFGQYRPSPGGGHAPWALQIIETNGDSITAWHSFLDTDRVFRLFGLPARLD